MEVSKNGLDLIKKFEGCRLKAYKCPAGVLTIGYGHTKGVKMGMTITQAEADELLKQDVEKYSDHVDYYNKTYKYGFNQNEFDALTSFAFNIGSLRGITNGGKRSKFQIGCKFNAYVYAGGKKLQGLVNRRKAEYELYTKPVVNNVNKYEPGSTYEVKVSGLKTRKEPSISAPEVNNKIRKGTKLKCIEIARDTSGNTWIRTDKGWNAAIYEGKVYVG